MADGRTLADLDREYRSLRAAIGAAQDKLKQHQADFETLRNRLTVIARERNDVELDDFLANETRENQDSIDAVTSKLKEASKKEAEQALSPEERRLRLEELIRLEKLALVALEARETYLLGAIDRMYAKLPPS